MTANSADDLLGTVNPGAADLPKSGIVEIANYGRHQPGLIPMWFGEGDLTTPAFIRQAASEALDAGHTFYTYQGGIPPLRQAIADYLNRHFDTAVTASRIIVTASGMQAITLTMQALVGPGDEVVVLSPVWPNIFAAIGLRGATAIPVALDFSPDGWQLDLDRLFAACGPRTKAIFINSPTNPTGWIIDPEDMLKVRDFARQRGLWIVADEVYAKLVYDRPRAESFLTIMEPDERLIQVNTFSKNWSMTGWRVGWMVIPEALGPLFEKLVQFNISGTATFLQHAATAAAERGDEAIVELVERCRQGRDIVCNRLAELPNVEFATPAGAFYLFFRVAGEADSMALARRLVDQANVGAAPGTAFGDGGAGFVRICFATSHQTLQTGIDRIAEALS